MLGRLEVRVAGAAQAVPAQVVAEDDQHVGPVRGRAGGGCEAEGEEGNQDDAAGHERFRVGEIIIPGDADRKHPPVGR